MGVTAEVIPLAPGETPEAAIARTREGSETWRPPADWGEACIARLEAIHRWRREDGPSVVYLWAPDAHWQVEIKPADATLRRRRHTKRRSAVSDAELLGSFADHPAIIHLADDGTWVSLTDLPDDFEIPGPPA